MTDPYGQWQQPQAGGPPGQWPQPAAAPPPGPPGTPAYGPKPYQQTSNNATVALVLALVSWVVCPIVCAIIALVYAGKGTKEIATSGGAVGGAGMVLAAKILAWVNIAVYVVAFGFFAVMIIIALVSGGFEPTYPEPGSTGISL